MLSACKNGVSRSWVGLMPALLCLSFTLVFSNTVFCQTSDADKGIPGPGTADLGNEAQVTIPANYLFFGPQSAPAAMKAAKLAPVKDLVGFMTSASGDGWSICFQFDPTGYISTDPTAKLNSESILKALQRQNKSGQVEWEAAPQYDSASHCLEYAVRIQNTGREIRQDVLQFLGKDGVVRATVLFQGLRDVSAIHGLAQVAFKKGHAYEDSQPSAPASSTTVADLIPHLPILALETEPMMAAKSAGTARMLFWLSLGILLAVATTALFFVWRKSRPVAAPTPVPQAPAQPRPTLITAATAAAAAAASAPAAPPVPAAELSVKDHNAPLPAPAAIRPKLGPTPMTTRPSNRKPLRTFTAHFGRRRKEFDYNRYFADLMATVSGHTGSLETPAGYALEVTHLANAVASNAPSASASANSELIANQTTLIEEQRRLIQEQTRLIEEKTKLIAEKNQLLKLQTELLEQKGL